MAYEFLLKIKQNKMATILEDTENLLINLEEYFEPKADADFDWGIEKLVGNEEMSFLSQIEQLLQKIEHHKKKQNEIKNNNL